MSLNPNVTNFYDFTTDDLMRLFGGDRMDRIAAMMARYDMPADVPIQSKLVSRAIESAQRKVEEINFAMRKQVLDYDDVMNEQRRVIYEERDKILDGKDLLGHINDVTYDTVRRKVEELCPEGQDPEDWDLVGLRRWVEGLTGRKDMPEFGSDLDRAGEEQGRDEGVSSEVMDAREGRESSLSEERGDGSDDGPAASISNPDEDAGSQPTGTGKGDEKSDSSGGAETHGKDGEEESDGSELANVASGEGDRPVQDGKKPLSVSPKAGDEDEVHSSSKDQDEPAGKEDEISVSGKSLVASKDSAKTIGTTNEDGGVSSSQSVRAVPSDDEGRDLFDIDDLDQIDVIDHVDHFVSGCYSEKSDQLPDGMMQALSAQVMLRVIDTRWMSYLQEMDYLRAGIGLRGFGQRDPLVEYKAEAYAAFTELVNTMYEDFLRTILRIELAPAGQARALKSEGDDALRGARYSGPAEVDGDQGSNRMSALR